MRCPDCLGEEGEYDARVDKKVPEKKAEICARCGATMKEALGIAVWCPACDDKEYLESLEALKDLKDRHEKSKPEGRDFRYETKDFMLIEAVSNLLGYMAGKLVMDMLDEIDRLGKENRDAWSTCQSQMHVIEKLEKENEALKADVSLLNALEDECAEENVKLRARVKELEVDYRLLLKEYKEKKEGE